MVEKKSKIKSFVALVVWCGIIAASAYAAPIVAGVIVGTIAVSSATYVAALIAPEIFNFVMEKSASFIAKKIVGSKKSKDVIKEAVKDEVKQNKDIDQRIEKFDLIIKQLEELAANNRSLSKEDIDKVKKIKSQITVPITKLKKQEISKKKKIPPSKSR